MTTEPSARVTVNEKPVPGVNTDELTSEANTKKTPPSATAKLTVPVPALSSAPSRLAAAPAPAWKLAPVTPTVRLARGPPELGHTWAIVGTVNVTVATAEEPSAKVTVSEKPAPLLNCVGLKSEANTKKTPPSATAKLTVPVPALSSAASRLAAAPRAQFAVAGSVSQTPPPLAV